MKIALSSLCLLLFTGPVFAEAKYENPVDGRTYVTEGQFKTYNPEHPRDQSYRKVATNGIRLLTGDPQLRERVQVNDLAAFIQAAEEKAYAILAQNKTSALVLLQFNCAPNWHEVKIATQGTVPEALLQALYESMKKLSPLRTKGEVIFQLELNVRT